MSAVNSSTSVQSAAIQSLSQIVAAQKQVKSPSLSDAQVDFRPTQAQDSVEISDEAREAYNNLKASVFGSLLTGEESVGSLSQSTDLMADPLVAVDELTNAQESIIRSILQSTIPQTPPNTANTAMPDPSDGLVVGVAFIQSPETSINFAFEAAKKAYLH